MVDWDHRLVGAGAAVQASRRAGGGARFGDGPDNILCSLQTKLVVPFSRPVVLGVTPADGVTTAFVVQVFGKELPGEQPKKVTFDASGTKTWPKFIEWLSDQTGLPYVGGAPPAGSITVKTTKALSIPDIIDLANEALAPQHLLIRGDKSLRIVPADERIDPAIIPQVDVGDLEKRGRSELVRAAIRLRHLVAHDIAPEIKKMVGPFGQVLPLNLQNSVVVADTAANVQAIANTLKQVDQKK